MRMRSRGRDVKAQDRRAMRFDFGRLPPNARQYSAKCFSAHGAGIQYVEHTEGDGKEMFRAICKLGLEGMVSKKLNAPYRSGPSRTWIKVKNPNAPATTRAIDGTF